MYSHRKWVPCILQYLVYFKYKFLYWPYLTLCFVIVTSNIFKIRTHNKEQILEKQGLPTKDENSETTWSRIYTIHVCLLIFMIPATVYIYLFFFFAKSLWEPLKTLFKAKKTSFNLGQNQHISKFLGRLYHSHSLWETL